MKFSSYLNEIKPIAYYSSFGFPFNRSIDWKVFLEAYLMQLEWSHDGRTTSLLSAIGSDRALKQDEPSDTFGRPKQRGYCLKLIPFQSQECTSYEECFTALTARYSELPFLKIAQVTPFDLLLFLIKCNETFLRTSIFKKCELIWGLHE